MPKVTEWNREFTFSVKFNDITYFLYLKENLLVRCKRHPDNRIEHLKQEAIIEHPDYGLMVWSEPEGVWCQIKEELLEAYSNYIAEKALLNSGR